MADPNPPPFPTKKTGRVKLTPEQAANFAELLEAQLKHEASNPGQAYEWEEYQGKNLAEHAGKVAGRLQPSSRATKQDDYVTKAQEDAGVVLTHLQNLSGMAVIKDPQAEINVLAGHWKKLTESLTKLIDIRQLQHTDIAPAWLALQQVYNNFLKGAATVDDLLPRAQELHTLLQTVEV
jgi:hypothetical protein